MAIKKEQAFPTLKKLNYKIYNIAKKHKATPKLG